MSNDLLSFTSSTDENFSHPFYRPILNAACDAIKDTNGGMWGTITTHQGWRLDCRVIGYGDSYVSVRRFDPESEKVGTETIVIPVDEILNIHIP